MATKICGSSDDLIEFVGDIRGEVGKYGTDNTENGVLIVCSDGTLLDIKYGKLGEGIWEITLLKSGNLFKEIVPCIIQTNKCHSDIAHFGDGLEWIFAGTEYEKVQ